MKSIVKRAGMLAAAFIVCVGDRREPELSRSNDRFRSSSTARRCRPANIGWKATNEVVTFVGEKGTKATAVVLTMPADGHDPAGDTPSLSFTHDETQYRLVDVWASGSRVSRLAADRAHTGGHGSCDTHWRWPR